MSKRGKRDGRENRFNILKKLKVGKNWAIPLSWSLTVNSATDPSTSRREFKRF
jgi:hypothetical protein